MMGTTKDSSRSQNEDDELNPIPWMYVSYNYRQQLIHKLNPPVTVSGNDWRMLADCLGYTQENINFIESSKGTNTEVLFNIYDTNPQASATAVYDALVKMKRKDCVDILDSALAEIKKNLKRARDSQMFHAAETSESLMSGRHYQWSNPSHSCAYPPHSAAAACGSHTYCPCVHGFASCMCRGHSHQHGHSPYQNPPLPPHTCPNLDHTDATCKICLPSISSPHHTSTTEHLSCHGIIHPPVPSSYGFGNGAPCRPHMNLSANHILNLQGHTDLSHGHSGYQGPSSCKYKENDCVIVEPVSHGLHYHRFPQMQQNNNSSGIHSDLSTSLSDTSQRRQDNNNSSQINVEGFKECSSNRQKITRQCSDDCNNPGESNADKRFRGANSQQGAVYHGGQDAKGGEKSGNNQSPRLNHCPIDVNFTDRNFHQGGIIKVENITMDSPPSSGGSSWDRCHPSSTFPMRVKPKHERTIEAINNLTIPKKSLSMPQNMKPATYRKAFRHIKVFVTYSYDNDKHAKQVLSLCKFLQDNSFACCVDVSNKDNSVSSSELLKWCGRKVIEADFVLVCISNKYLEDIATDKQSTLTNSNEHPLHTKEIYDLMITRQPNGQQSTSDNSSDFTQFPCVIYLLFPEMTQKHIPHSMVNGPIYKWPKQYVDLAWVLTKPQERMKVKKETQDLRKETDQEGAFGMDNSH